MNKIIADLKGIPTKVDLLEVLNNEIIVVTFKKLDGDERTMTCTRSLEFIPEESRPKSGIDSKKDNISVWDVNAKGWRSFLYDRVIKVDFIKKEV